MMKRLVDRLIGFEMGTPERAAKGGRLGFLRDDDGAFIIFGLFIFVTMLVAGGLGVDIIRHETQRNRIQATLDRAILAAASAGQTLPADEVVLDYFTRAGLGDVISPENITVVEGTSSRYVSVEVSTSMPTTFLRIPNYLQGIRLVDQYMGDVLMPDSFAINANGAAEEAISSAEISLVVDVSGSMAWAASSGNTRIYDLKQAAKKFVNMMLCDPNDPNETVNCTVEEDKVSVTLVPYAEQVLLGENLIQRFNITDEHSRSSCVTFQDTEFGSIEINNTQALQRTGEFDDWYAAGDPVQQGVFPCLRDSWREVEPYEGSAAQLRNEIDALGAVGATSIDLGMKWGSAFLDPQMRPVVQSLADDGIVQEGFEGRPLDYDTRGLEKVIVLMTDGENTDQAYLRPGFHAGFSPVWQHDDDNRYLSVYNEDTDMYYWVSQGRWEDHPFGEGSYQVCNWYWSWYKGWYQSCNMVNEGSGATRLSYPQLWLKKTTAWYNQFPWLNDPTDRFGNSDKNRHLDEVCTAAKAKGIVVFTIGFEIPDGSPQHTVMQNCASAGSYYYDVDGLDIQDAFGNIAREITKLRLVN